MTEERLLDLVVMATLHPNDNHEALPRQYRLLQT